MFIGLSQSLHFNFGNEIWYCIAAHNQVYDKTNRFAVNGFHVHGCNFRTSTDKEIVSDSTQFEIDNKQAVIELFRGICT